MDNPMTDNRYPIGTFKAQDAYSNEEVSHLIDKIAALPHSIEQATKGMTDDQLDTPYREGGWTIRQVIHHLPDSHMNAYIRVKWTLTEESPVIKAYHEKAWAETGDNKLAPDASITLLKSLHAKWVGLLKNIPTNDLKKEFIHPDTKKSIRLDKMIALYAWHGEHHLAHITTLKERMGWRNEK